MLGPDPTVLEIGDRSFKWQALASPVAPNLIPGGLKATTFDAATEAMCSGWDLGEWANE